MFYTEKCAFTSSQTEYFRILGRTLSTEEGLALSWSNSGIEFCFEGDRAEIHFGEYDADQPAYVRVFADKKTYRVCLDGKAPKVLVEFEKQTKHTVKIIRISEGDTPLRFLHTVIYGKKPSILPKPTEKTLKIQFMGDSITAGYGVFAPRESNDYHTYEQDSTKTYAYLTAEKLDAEIRTVCISGQGVYRNCNGDDDRQFCKIFDMTIRGVFGYDHATWQPDIMVLNCGTNDVGGGTTEETMYSEGSKLLDQVRAAYPNAEIIWMYGMMNNKFHDTLKSLIKDKNKQGDSKLHYLYVKDIYGKKNEVGAVGHPNVNASVRASKALVAFIKKILK